MLAYAWRSRCCVIYVSRRPSPCDRFMQHNIEHKGEWDYNNQSAYDLRTCTDVANFIPSTVSVNVVKDPWHIHWTDKSARAYAQHSTMRRHTKLREYNWKTMLLEHCWHLEGKAEKRKGSSVWCSCVCVCGMCARVHAWGVPEASKQTNPTNPY